MTNAEFDRRAEEMKLWLAFLGGWYASRGQADAPHWAYKQWRRDVGLETAEPPLKD